MKIGILTQPLYCNYGGMIQCYALQHVLQGLGHEAVVLQREFNRRYTLKGACLYYAKHMVKLMLGRPSSWHYKVSQLRRDYIAQNTYQFINKHINPRTKRCYTTRQLADEVASRSLDAVVVGSDQVWRPDYSPCQPNYFFDFLSEDSRIKRISYAASFGGDEWRFSPEMTTQCGMLLKKFDAVSVREASGVGLCKKYFGVDAVQVLDPTMLLEPEDYRRLVGDEREPRGSLFCYVLDKADAKQAVIKTIAEKTSKTPFETMPELDDSPINLYGSLDQCVYPPVEDWLSAFMEAEMVVTDSFHGTVFSILFNKPFWVVGNAGRGMARFHSLLSLYGLEDRMITPDTVHSVDLDAPIDWSGVNKRRQKLKDESMEFLRTALKTL